MYTVGWALAAWLLCAAATWAQEGIAPGADEAALLALRGSITNWPAFAAANAIRGWDSSLPLCQWTGVACTPAGSVQSVSLQCEGCPVQAQGSLPAALADLAAATTLNLQGNAFGGGLPREWGAPGAMQAMQSMYLNDNQLTGSIPDSWGSPGAFPQLSLLRADGNRLGGSLPAGWGGGGGGGGGGAGGSQSLPNLLVLRLSRNRLSGGLPEAWGSAGAFPRLQILSLQNNSLTGAVPASWQDPGAMQYLQELYLQENQLAGQLPSSWGTAASWPVLRFLYLDSNPLTGTLPPEWGEQGSFPALKVLGLNGTLLTGTLPPQWGAGGFAAADAFWLERNDLSGTVPAAWAGLASLRRLVLRPGNPRLCGPVPPGLPFAVCTDQDVSCLREQPTLLDGECAAAAAGGGVPAPAPAAADEGNSGGGGVSAAAIAAPVAAGAAVLAAAAAWAVARRRRRRRRGGGAGQAADERGLGGMAHPFDTEEGRAALTSPFAAGAFQAGAARSHSGSSCHPAPPAASGGHSADAARQRSASPALRRGPHDSVGTRSSSISGGSSARSYLAAKCARIETKSIGLSPSGAYLAGTAAGGSSSESTGGGGGAGRAPATPPPGGAGALELQPVAAAAAAAGLSPSEAEEREMVGAMLSPQGGSSDRTSAEEGMPSPYPELPFSDWEISPAEIEIVKRPDGSDWSLGSGGFGKVYKALRHGVQPVAVKVLATQGEMRQVALADFRKEIAILKACRDVNIVQFVGACLTPDQTMLVTEYMEGGNLSSNIAAGRVGWYRRGKKIALDVARGLVFLHSRRIVHFDLKSPNILLTRDGTAKIGDVGMARIIARDYVTGVVGTLAWSAPEMLWGERCTERADIYSYGIVLWEICSGEKPLRGQLRDLRVPQECPSGVRDLILECLETRPSRRPSAFELVQRLQALPGEPPSGVRPTPSPSQPSSQPTPSVAGSSPSASRRAANASAAAPGQEAAAAAAAAGSAEPSGTAGVRSADGAPAGRGAASAAAGRGGAGASAAALALRVLGMRSRSLDLSPLSDTAAARLQQWREGQPGAAEAAAGAAAAEAQRRRDQGRSGGSGVRRSF